MSPVGDGTGWGNVNQPMFVAIKAAIGKGIPVVITSRVPNGAACCPTTVGRAAGKTLLDAGAVTGDDFRGR